MNLKRLIISIFILASTGCSSYSKKIGGGMLAGAAVGAAVGYQFVHHGPNKQYETRNTIITAIVFGLATGGVLSWHYRAIEETKVEISGRYARYRLCDPQDLKGGLMSQLQMDSSSTQCSVFQIEPKQVGRLAISLDDHTKWVYPSFRKRYLKPERDENQVVSERYIWEIVVPGQFVTRSQNPQYFIEIEENQ